VGGYSLDSQESCVKNAMSWSLSLSVPRSTLSMFLIPIRYARAEHKMPDCNSQGCLRGDVMDICSN
jgi:hypothetical protein